MKTRIIINGNEITNPFTKALMMLTGIIIAAVAAALVIFVLFPLIGIAVTLSVGVIAVFVVAIVVSVAVLSLVTILYSWLFGSAEFRVERYRRK